MADPVVAALDVGGTKMEAGVVAGGRILSRRRAATAGVDGEELFELAVGLVDDAIRAAGGQSSSAAVGVPAVLGVGCGGPMTGPALHDPDAGAATVSPLNIAQWRGFPLGPRLSERLGVAVRVDNDAKALALAEGRFGAARGVRDYVAMVVSTGVGGGIVVDGRLLDGGSGNAGHIGHLIVDPLGRRCGCGARGCLEAQVSGTALAEATGVPAAGAAPATRRWAGRLVGRAVASVCNLLDLRLAVVAGSVALGFGEPFFSEAQAELERLAQLEFSAGARIVPAGCGADGPLLGAASVGLERLDRHRSP